MNHGYCKNCYWWKECYPGFGKCYMHNSNEDRYIITKENSYCPDYHNRKKEKEHSLDDFIKNMEEQLCQR